MKAVLAQFADARPAELRKTAAEAKPKNSIREARGRRGGRLRAKTQTMISR